ncbi:MAG: alcohol dehydrogenase catalytic domain-containing protein [Deltaproteobacteria bacterium]|nr:alcohol dehydrogenase catalytic domain-containing protein [Deltaproteobacteria bacterium]
MQALQFHVTVPKFIAAKAMKALMGNRAFFKGPFRTVRLVDIPEPTLPSADWVKIRTIMCGFCGSDLNLILLNESPTASPFTSFPCVIGHEIIGEIVDAGPGVRDFKPGDRVAVNPILGCETRDINPICPTCRAGRPANCENFAEGSLPPGMFTGINNAVTGGFAPIITAHKSQLFRIPDTLSSPEAVMAEPVAVALQAVLDNPPREDEKILVIGSGVIGNLLIQSVREVSPGAHIAVIEPSSFAADLAMKAGAHDIIQMGDAFSQTARITGATVYKPLLGAEIPMGGFHRIYDTVGNESTLNLSLRLLNNMGVLSVVGIGGNAKLDLTPLWLKLQTIKGVYGNGLATYQGKIRSVFELALEFMAQSKIQTAHMVTHEFPLAAYREMIEVNLDKKKTKDIKTVVSFA